MRRNISAPALWPAVRGRPRFVAQRPLPSMMIAMWRGGGRTWPAEALMISCMMDSLISKWIVGGASHWTEEIAEAPPAADEARRFRGSGAIGGPARGRKSQRRDGVCSYGDSWAMHPPFLFWSCQKRNGPCTVQREKTLWSQLCTYVQSTGAAGCRRDLTVDSRGAGTEVNGVQERI